MKRLLRHTLLTGLLMVLSAVSLAKDDKEKGLPPGLQKKADQGQPLPPGWQKKLAVGERLDPSLYEGGVVLRRNPERGEVTVQIDNEIITVIENTLEIIDILRRQ